MRLDVALVREFFTAQIEAAKKVQRADFERWKAEKRGRFASVRELAGLREEIDRINDELLSALAEIAPDRREDAARRAMRSLREPRTK